jgi:hypothetical protein
VEVGLPVGLALSTVMVGLAQVLTAPGLEYFPGEYFVQTTQPRLEQQVLTSWPGAAGLLGLWRSGALDERERVALLLGGASFHDPTLLPVYLEGMASPNARVRQAAAFGYRELLADQPPPTGFGADAAGALQLLPEMRAVTATLARHSLVELWLAALLHNEGRRLPGWDGVVLRRPAPLCSNALDRLVQLEDLQALVEAFAVAEAPPHRASLAALIDGLTLARPPLRPQGTREGWSPPAAAEERVRAWVEGQCSSDAGTAIAARLGEASGQQLDPWAAEACVTWQRLLQSGPPAWWPVAARQLHRCGAPPTPLSIRRVDSPSNRDQRAALLGWLGLRSGSGRR